MQTVSPKFSIDHSPYPCATSPHTIDPDLFILGEDMTAFGPLCLDQQATQLAEPDIGLPYAFDTNAMRQKRRPHPEALKAQCGCRHLGI